MEPNVEAPLITDGELKTIEGLASQALALQDAIKIKEAELKLLTTRYNEIALVDLPEAMASVGMLMFKLSSGRTIEIKPDVATSISDGDKEEAHKWLRENNLGDIIKNVVSVNFGRAGDEDTKALIDYLIEHKLTDFDRKEAVHAQTLKATVKDCLARGVAIPFGPFGIFPYKKATIK